MSACVRACVRACVSACGRAGGRAGGREGGMLSANSAIFQLCHGENKLIFNEMTMRSTLF